MIPFDGLFFPNVTWNHVPLENLTVQFDPNFPLFRRMDLLGGTVSWDTQHMVVVIFQQTEGFKEREFP